MKKQAAEREVLDALLGRGGAPARADGALAKPFDDIEPETDGQGASSREPRQELLRTLSLKVRVELGRRRMQLKEALQLSAGAVVELDGASDDHVELYVGDLLVARGEVLVVDGSFCVRIKEVMPPTGEGEP